MKPDINYPLSKKKEGVTRSYRGQCALERPDRCIMPDHTCRWSFPDGILKDLATWSMDMEFDESILAWHLATDEFLTKYSESADAKPLVEATKAVSNYMMFLLVERPYMLPSPLFDPHCISKPGKCCGNGVT